jgi:hypothetical protein
MKISSSELDGLIRFISMRPYRPLEPIAKKMLKRLKKERAKRDVMKKNLYVIAQAIRVTQRKLPESENGIFAREVIQAVAKRIAIELVACNSEFDPDLFLHTCGVKV